MTRAAVGSKLESIQAGRSLAAWSVVLGHALAYAGVIGGPALADLSARNWFTPTVGQSGVDVFFVISGIIMVVVIARMEGRSGGLRLALGFLWRRAVRIFPLYWVVMPVAVAVDVTHSFEWERFWSPILLIHQPDGFPVAWSLVFETRFYLLLTPALFFTGKTRRRLLSAAFALIAFAVALQSLGIMDQPMFGDTILLEFVLGGLVGALVVRGVGAFRNLAIGLGLCGFVAGTLAFSPIVGADIVTWRFLGFGLSAALVFYGLAAKEARRELTMPALIVRDGDQSYSLYLWHWVVITAAYFTWPLAFYGASGASLFLVLTVTLSWLAARLSYRLIETPILRLGMGVLDRRSAPA